MKSCFLFLTLFFCISFAWGQSPAAREELQHLSEKLKQIESYMEGVPTHSGRGIQKLKLDGIELDFLNSKETELSQEVLNGALDLILDTDVVQRHNPDRLDIKKNMDFLSPIQFYFVLAPFYPYQLDSWTTPFMQGNQVLLFFKKGEWTVERLIKLLTHEIAIRFNSRVFLLKEWSHPEERTLVLKTADFEKWLGIIQNPTVIGAFQVLSASLLEANVMQEIFGELSDPYLKKVQSIRSKKECFHAWYEVYRHLNENRVYDGWASEYSEEDLKKVFDKKIPAQKTPSACLHLIKPKIGFEYTFINHGPRPRIGTTD